MFVVMAAKIQLISYIAFFFNMNYVEATLTSTSRSNKVNIVSMKSLLVVHALYAVGDGGEDLVGDGLQQVAEDGDGQVGTEDLDGVAFVAVDVGDIDEGHVHADVADVGGVLSIDDAVAVAVA